MLAAIGSSRQIPPMARDDHFDRKQQDANVAVAVYASPMIRTVMNRSDWLTLIGLAVIWGSAFFCIHVAVHAVPPLTYVWLRVTIAAAALWGWRSATAAALLAIGLLTQGVGLAQASPEFDLFSPRAELAPSTLLGERQ